MSAHTWKKKYMPTSADGESAKRNPIKHSLHKWRGLTDENLKRHNINIYDVYPTAVDCALCNIYYPDCTGCPVKEVSGMTCEHPRSEFMEARRGNVQPMIDLLEFCEFIQGTCK